MKKMKLHPKKPIVSSPPPAPTPITPVSPVNVSFYNSSNPTATTQTWQTGENETIQTYNSDTEVTMTFVVNGSFTYSLQVGGAAGAYSVSFPVDPNTGSPFETIQAFQ